MASATVLCIDDNPQLLELRKTTLESYGYCVEIASSGDAALPTGNDRLAVFILGCRTTLFRFLRAACGWLGTTTCKRRRQ